MGPFIEISFATHRSGKKDVFVFFFILVVRQSETGNYRKAFVQRTRPNVENKDNRSDSCSDAGFLSTSRTRSGGLWRKSSALLMFAATETNAPIRAAAVTKNCTVWLPKCR